AGQLEKMPPVHEHEENRAVPGMGLRAPEKRGQEGDEFGFRHLSGGHRKLLVTDVAEPGDVAVDTHIVWGVREHQIGTLTLEQSRVIVLTARVATEEAMRTQNPNIALSRDRRRNDRRHIIFRTWSNRRLLGCLIQD